MRASGILGSAVAAAILIGAPAASAGPWEDGMVAYNRGDYLPAMHLFRPLAQAGNTKAQAMMGKMYHKGEGVKASAARAFMWFSLAAGRGNAGAKASLRDVAGTMTPAEVSRAQAMAAACEASNYRDCEY